MKKIIIFLESCYFAALGTCPNLGDKKERVLILHTFRSVSIDFSFLSPI
jgi:hypothetical protein